MSEQKKLGTQGSLIFMNTPIADSAEDVIGFSTYVEKLDAAIASGGQMIALTSPFGAGKTSIAELLQNKYKNDAEKRVVKVSMWSHLASGMGEEQVKGDTTELHKGFVYQLITQINRRKGQYISRLLNPSFGLLKLQINKVRYWLYTIAALILFLFGYILPKKFDFSLPFLGEKAASWEWVMVFSSAVFLALIVTRAEVVFSSNKSEGGRKIDTNEIMQLYRAEVLGYKLKCCNNGHHYIAVIEDLDRTDDNEAVINFLKELRRYYVPENELNNGIVYKNRVTFLINVKPEALLYGDKCTEDEHEHLYAKLFDFVLNLQTINIDDYNTILEGLLQQKKDELRTLGFNCDGRMIDIPGMRWMTRGKRLGIREIKDRLNTAFSLYESLNKKFGDTIEFEKCALSAFIVTEYEADFHATDDLAFQKLVSAYLKGELNDSKIDEVLSKNCTSYKRSVRNLIESKQINNNYRIYFYNYPRAGRVLSSDEAIVQQAILYDEAPESLEDSIQKVVQEGSSIIRDSIEDRNNLGLMLPDIVFRNEELYIQSLKYAFPKVVMWVQKLDYSTDASEKTIEQLKNLLRFDPARTVYSKKHAQEFVKVWEEKFSETALLQFRKLLCHEFPQEIFLELRASIINEKIEIIRQYQFMFNEGCPIMTENEFIMLKHSSILDRDIMSLLPPTLVTENEIAMLVSYFCRHRQSNNESYEILLYISRLRPSVAKAMFYALNFDMIRYRYIASERRNKVKKAFWDILALDEVEEKIRFMTATRILDSAWENQMRDELNEDEDLRDAYVAAVRRDDASREITKTTVQILCSFSTVPAVQKRVYRRYYELGYYKQYVSCATRDQKKFEMEGGERGALLWPVYVEIFGHSGYEMTWKYMSQSREFLEKLMHEKAYIGMEANRLLPLASIQQDKECIEYFLGLDTANALEYLTKIDGFADRPAAEAFVEGVVQHLDLLRSDELYAHTHNKLLDGILKAKYTRARTRNGF